MSTFVSKSIGLRATFCAVALFWPSVQLLASSIWCEPPRVSPADWAQKSLSEADTIILGRVFSIKEVPQEEPEPATTDDATSMAELLRRIEAEQQTKTRIDHVVSFEVLKAWKDPPLPIVRTKVYLGTLKEVRLFREGDIYLVVWRDLEGSLYRIENRCQDAIWYDWAEKYEAALDAAVSGK